ncbi:MAG: hypothetical protein KJ737_14105 [Proteobacteria bacterium]|nr:hypothetical protein [Pseudomonadota bacterium]
MTSDYQLRNILRKEKEQLALRQKILAMTSDKALAEILNSDQPAGLVQSFSEEDLYFLIHEIGLDDALPVISLAASKQWEYILDLETWHRDKIDLQSVSKWMHLFFQADKNRLVHWLMSEKVEWLEYYLFKHIDVRIRQHDEDPSDFDEHHFTLDDIYYIRFLGNSEKRGQNESFDDDQYWFEKQFLEHLAEIDHTTYQSLLIEAMSVLSAEFEEENYRLRNVRLAEKGFVPFDQAIEIYAPITVEAVTGYGKKSLATGGMDDDRSFSLPPVAMNMKRDSGYFSDALAIIEKDQMFTKIQIEFATLLNTIISADQEPVREREQLAGVIKKAAGYLGIGLEILTGEKEKKIKKAAAMIQQYQLAHIFRLGYSRSLKLKFRANKWVKKSWFKSKGLPLSFWDEKLMGILGGLLVRHPLFFDNYETGVLYREFDTLSDISRTENSLEEIINLDNLFSLMTIDLKAFSDPRLSYIKLILTLFASHFAGVEPARPIHLGELKVFFQKLWGSEENRIKQAGKISEGVRTFFLGWLSDRTGLTSIEISDQMGKTLETIFQEMESEYGNVSLDDLDPRFIDLIYLDIP